MRNWRRRRWWHDDTVFEREFELDRSGVSCWNNDCCLGNKVVHMVRFFAVDLLNVFVLNSALMAPSSPE